MISKWWHLVIYAQQNTLQSGGAAYKGAQEVSPPVCSKMQITELRKSGYNSTNSELEGNSFPLELEDKLEFTNRTGQRRFAH